MNTSQPYRITSTYVRTNRNFAILNLPDTPGEESALQRTAKVCNNILCRGYVVNPSTFLRNEFWGSDEIVNPDEKTEPTFLLSTSSPTWDSSYLNDSPSALEFIETILPNALGDWKWIVSLIRPEVTFTTIFDKEQEDFINQSVDFFVPYINLVIEIDGAAHRDEHYNDSRRDQKLKANKIDVIRIKTSDISERTKQLDDAISKIIGLCESNPILSGYFKPVAELITAKTPNPEWVETLLIPTYVIRLQHVLLQLIIRGVVTDDQPKWKVSLAIDKEFMGLQLSNYHERIVELALTDLWQSLSCVSILLNGEEFQNEFDLHLTSREAINKRPGSTIKIDLGLDKWDSHDLMQPAAVICRSDGFDTFVGRGGKTLKRDYHRLSTVANLILEFDESGEGDLKGKALEHLLEDIFGYPAFNDGQLPIIKNVLSGEDTIGLLPTGRGKSICYQLPGILKGGTTIVICPIKALMRDQQQELSRVGITRVQTLNSDLSPNDRELLLQDVNKGNCRFLFISPEQMQKESVRALVANTSAQDRLSYVVIDEAHCLSEWGHDFRVSYLNLKNAFEIETLHTQYIILTATASLNVLQDIQIEFNIEDYNLRTIEDYGRPELKFEVKEAYYDKYDSLSSFIGELQKRSGFPVDSDPDAGAGIIFTPFVNGDYGCYDLATSLTNDKRLNGVKPKVFAGSLPHNYPGNRLKWEGYKAKTQKDFKDKQFSLLVATKAFGMGINMQNARFTVHYGIPSSIEALYQEAGRAGRDGKPATCLTILTPEEDDCEILSRPTLGHEELRVFLRNKSRTAQNDVRRQLYLMAIEDDSVLSNYRFLTRAFDLAKRASETDEIITVADFNDLGRQFGIRDLRQKVERMIYRLRQLGVVDDWVVKGHWNANRFHLTFGSFELNDIETAFVNILSIYEVDFDPDTFLDDIKLKFGDELTDSKPSISLYLLGILKWVEDHFLYQRRLQLFNVLDICKNYRNIGALAFRHKLESYFKITGESQVLQVIADGGLAKINLTYNTLLAGAGNRTHLKPPKAMKTIAGGLVRFLESYQNNAGLNLLSGLIQLFTEDELSEANLDRVKTSFQSQTDNGLDPLQDLLDFAEKLPVTKRAPLAHITSQIYSSREDTLRIYTILQDGLSHASYLEAVGKQLNSINNRIQVYVGS
jgi:ATP-dependent DNA helicase RecQ